MKSKSKLYLFTDPLADSFKDFLKKGKPNKSFVFFKTVEQCEKHYFSNYFIDYRTNNEDNLELFYLNGANHDDVKLFFEKTDGKRFVIETYFGL